MAPYPMRAYAAHRPAAEATERLFHALCGSRPTRVPGMCAVIRLAVRLDRGASPERAAALEYLYRWNLALRWPGFGVPHTMGM